MNIFTSLAPSRLDVEKRAVRSWQALGLGVYSVNCPEEAAKLSPEFPGVRFLITSDTLEKVVRKPCVKISAIIAWAQQMTEPDEVFGIINSDIILRPYPATLARIAEEGRTGCVAVHRREIGTGEAYELGFDAFFLRHGASLFLPPADFAMGIPAWDYWLPAFMMSRGYRIIRVEEAFADHETHKPFWNGGMMALFRRYAETLGLGATDDMYMRIMVNSTLLKGE